MLPATGTLAYNGVAFDTLTKIKVTATPVFDDAGRMVKWVEHILHVRGYITVAPNSTTDTTLGTMRSRLTQAGQALVFTGKGYNPLIVNSLADGPATDVNWGPKPEVLSWMPIGNNVTALVEWQVRCHVPECDTPTYKNAIMAFTSEANFAIEDGYTTITTTGSVEIPQTRGAGSGAASTPDCVDAYRERVAPAPLIGFKRNENYSVASNRSKMTFNVVDKQMAQQALPSGVAKAELDFSVKSQLKGTGFINWICSLSGSITVPPNSPKGTAFDVFKAIFSDKFDQARSQRRPGRAGSPSFITDSFEIRDSVFNPETYFNLQWRIMGSSLQAIVADSGMWKPIKNASHSGWMAAMKANGVLSARGTAGYKMLPGDDILIDLCNGKQPSKSIFRGKTVDDVFTRKLPRSESLGDGRQADVPEFRGGGGNKPDPGSSWLKYSAEVELQQRNDVVRHKPLNGTTNDNFPNLLTAVDADAAERVTTTPGSDAASSQPDILQKVGSPTALLVLSGYAERLGYPIEPPQLVSVGGVPCVESSRVIRHRESGVYGGIPSYVCLWRISYELPGPIRTMPMLANPLLGTDGNLGS